MRRHLLILGIIYLGFISLGLPDTVLGIAWPEMRRTFALPLSAAGVLVTVTTVCSVLSSTASGWIAQRWSAGVVLAASGLLTMSAMLGYSLSPAWTAIVLLTVPLGFGQGAVDSSLNAYVARHYSSRQMNWLHCCWGIGATGGPLLMTRILESGNPWRMGYLIIALIQAILTALFFLTLRLWEKDGKEPAAQPINTERTSRHDASADSGARSLWPSLFGALFYFIYPGLETTAGLWGASMLMSIMDASLKNAGIAVSIFWASLTLGRIIAGLLASRLGNVALLRGGLALSTLAAVAIMATRSAALAGAALMLLGLGLAPLYPTMMHDTPNRVGKNRSEKAIGLQVGSNFAGVALLPPLCGYVAARSSLAIVGPWLVTFALLLIAIHECSLKSANSRMSR